MSFENHSEVELTAMARTVGRRVARKWQGVDPEDLAQEALAELYTKVDKLADKETRYLYRVMERAAMSFASKQRYDKMLETSEYVYTSKEVRALLSEAYFDPEAWDVPSKKDDPTKDWIEVGTIGVSLMDAKSAFDKVNATDRAALEERFFHQGGVAGDAREQKAVQRAVDNLTKYMNWGKDQRHDTGFEGRTAVSNNRARAITDSAFEGDAGADALEKLQKEYADFGLRPGEGYDWDKYKTS